MNLQLANIICGRPRDRVGRADRVPAGGRARRSRQ